ncbi:hypothetical protein FALCPG4_015138 [Fusarium falciforme]
MYPPSEAPVSLTELIKVFLELCTYVYPDGPLDVTIDSTDLAGEVHATLWHSHQSKILDNASEDSDIRPLFRTASEASFFDMFYNLAYLVA